MMGSMGEIDELNAQASLQVWPVFWAWFYARVYWNGQMQTKSQQLIMSLFITSLRLNKQGAWATTAKRLKTAELKTWSAGGHRREIGQSAFVGQVKESTCIWHLSFPWAVLLISTVTRPVQAAELTIQHHQSVCWHRLTTGPHECVPYPFPLNNDIRCQTGFVLLTGENQSVR